MAYAALSVVVAYPLIVLGLYLTPKDKLKTNNVKARVSTVYSELNFRYTKRPLLWPLFMILHKLLLAYTLVFIRNFQWI